MSETFHDTIDPETLEEFFLDFSDEHQNCENILIDLEHAPDDKELLNALFRSIHNIKGNLIYVGMKPVTPLIQSIEDLLDAIRKDQLRYDHLLSDLILLAMDKTKQLVNSRIHHLPSPLSDASLDELCQTISSIAEVSRPAQAELISKAIIALDPDISVEATTAPETGPATMASPSEQPPEAPLSNVPSEESDILEFFGIEPDDDIRFFKSLSAPLENRSLYWKNRTVRMLRLTLAINQHAGNPVEPAQLAAAVYLHDIGMAFMPLEILHKKTALNQEEKEILHTHPGMAANLLSATNKWDQAATIIAQHHERHNGKGYPQGLKSDQICPGAKILSLADTFDACTHVRAYSTGLKRPLIRAVLEINRCSGTEFDSQWVDIFNEVARQIYA